MVVFLFKDIRNKNCLKTLKKKNSPNENMLTDDRGKKLKIKNNVRSIFPCNVPEYQNYLSQYAGNTFVLTHFKKLCKVNNPLFI